MAQPSYQFSEKACYDDPVVTPPYLVKGHSLYLVVLLQYVVHLGDVLTGHGLDNESVVIAGQEAVAETTLGVTVEGGAPRQRILTHRKPQTQITVDHST